MLRIFNLPFLLKENTSDIPFGYEYFTAESGPAWACFSCNISHIPFVCNVSEQWTNMHLLVWHESSWWRLLRLTMSGYGCQWYLILPYFWFDHLAVASWGFSPTFFYGRKLITYSIMTCKMSCLNKDQSGFVSPAEYPISTLVPLDLGSASSCTCQHCMCITFCQILNHSIFSKLSCF